MAARFYHRSHNADYENRFPVSRVVSDKISRAQSEQALLMPRYHALVYHAASH